MSALYLLGQHSIKYLYDAAAGTFCFVKIGNDVFGFLQTGSVSHAVDGFFDIFVNKCVRRVEFGITRGFAELLFAYTAVIPFTQTALFMRNEVSMRLSPKDGLITVGFKEKMV